MYATSEQAIEGLRHKRSNEVLPTKIIDRNTRLVYYCDEMVALRFHKTDIAIYTPNGVRIDTRSNPSDPSPHGEGWFTMTTWQRINDHTPASNYTQGGIRYVKDRLYLHGMFITPDGEIDSPVEREVEDAILHVLRTYPAKLRRHAAKVADAWESWEGPWSCCANAQRDGEWEGHYLRHIEANEYVVPPRMHVMVNNLRANDCYGERLMVSLRKQIRTDMKPMLRLAVKRVWPEFPYPQLTKRNERT